MHIRKGCREDSAFVLKMIQQLAKYEKAEDRVKVTLEQLENDGFGDRALYETLILELDNRPVGMALYYNRYSTWMGKSLYLEDLYVIPEARGNGLGLKAMKKLAQIAVETNCYRFEWQVLDWNEPSIKFYESLNTDLDSEWINCRLEGDSLHKLATE